MSNSTQWKDVDGWPNYMVSNTGIIYQKVRTLRRMPGVLKPQLSGQSGYHQVQLVDGYNRKFFYVHQLVAKAFIPNPECKPKVNHLDGNKANNHYSNLEWCTQSENMYHALENGLHPHSDKYVNKRSIAIQMIKEGYRPKEIIQATGYHAVSISRLKNQITPIENVR